MSDDEDMCGNCVTPWKCNGPHVVEPDSSALDRLMRRARQPLPEATWRKPGDLSNLSIEAMERREEGKP